MPTRVFRHFHRHPRAQIDDVCVKMLLNGQQAQALDYLSRLRDMIGQICTQLGAQREKNKICESHPSGRSTSSSHSVVLGMDLIRCLFHGWLRGFPSPAVCFLLIIAVLGCAISCV